MGEQINNPSDDFVKLFAAQVLPGRMTQAVREQFTQATRRALKQFINDQVNERLKTALGGETRIIADAPPVAVKTTPVEVNNEEPPIQVQTVTTTAQELESFYIVKAILRESVDAKRIVMRDVQTYCGVLLDDNNRKPICRLYFNSVQHSLGLFGNADRKETRVPITSLDELYKYADRLKTTVGFYIK